MEAHKMSDDFDVEASRLAIQDLQDNMRWAERNWEDAKRSGDADAAKDALRQFNALRLELDAMTGANQPQQPGLTNAQMNFISRRSALGDDVQTNPQRARDYHLAHTRAVNAGLTVDSPQYFAALERSLDSMGDGRDPSGLLNERQAARICGVDEATYSANAAKLRAMRARGEYS
jgi:hypothetical protein